MTPRLLLFGAICLCAGVLQAAQQAPVETAGALKPAVLEQTAPPSTEPAAPVPGASSTETAPPEPIAPGTATPEPADVTLTIVAPVDNTMVSGNSLVRALILPPRLEVLVDSMSIYADGQLLCRVEAPPFECGWDAGTRIREHTVRAVADLRDQRRLVHNVRTRGVEFSDSVDVNVVQVTAAVSDSSGKFVSQLTQGMFRVYEDNVEQDVTHFAAEHSALEVVVAVDVSGSMASAMPTVRESVKRFLRQLREGDSVSLLAFNDTVFTLGRRETSTAGRLRAVDRLAAWGGTALYDTVLRALDSLGRQQGRRALVIFSDGEDQSSHAPLDNVIKRVEASDATLFFIGQGRGAQVASLMDIQNRLSKVSGGRAFQTANVNELDGVFEQILNELSNQYLLAYQPRSLKMDDTWHDIRVELAETSETSDYKVRARQGYRAVPKRREGRP